ncbi:hypothetical protein H2203_002383 [Taxawa tesnikishii (nom. ined.)]|nr:hypothetical protein H2203_002383 [Dothideales sp. JES 119]
MVSSSAVKLCLTSRPRTVFDKRYDSFTRPFVRRLVLQQYTQEDMHRLINGRLIANPRFNQLMQEDENEVKKLVDEIEEKASGVFFWVILAVNPFYQIAIEVMFSARECGLRDGFTPSLILDELDTVCQRYWAGNCSRKLHWTSAIAIAMPKLRSDFSTYAAFCGLDLYLAEKLDTMSKEEFDDNGPWLLDCALQSDSYDMVNGTKPVEELLRLLSAGVVKVLIDRGVNVNGVVDAYERTDFRYYPPQKHLPRTPWERFVRMSCYCGIYDKGTEKDQLLLVRLLLEGKAIINCRLPDEWSLWECFLGRCPEGDQAQLRTLCAAHGMSVVERRDKMVQARVED